MMHLSEHQPNTRIFVDCELEDFAVLPKPDHVTDYQTGWWLVEFERTVENRVALRLCGLEIHK